MMKAALYLRISTDKQELENQLEPLKEFAKGRGLNIPVPPTLYQRRNTSIKFLSSPPIDN